MTYAIEAEGLIKRFGDRVALDRVDLRVPAGQLVALLGPDGAGKTTAVRILATLLRPDGGRVRVAGHDVTKDPARVRSLIGPSGQDAAPDERLSATRHLVLCGRLLHLSERRAAARADELLERFALTGVATRPIATLPSGVRRRLDLAAGLVAGPRIVVLDEPAAGLDSHGRDGVWDVVRGLVTDGSAVLLATQDLEEADRLADRISVIDRGRVVAEGRPAELRRRVGGQILHVRPALRADVEAVARILTELTGLAPARDAGTGLLTAPVSDQLLISALVRRLDSAGITADELGLRPPTLDEVMLALAPA